MRAKTSLIAILLALGTGCTDISRMATSFQRLVTTNTDRLTARRVIDDAIHLESPGVVSVDVSSFNGPVEVEADPDVDHIVVLFERLATHGYGRKWEADASLGEIYHTVDILPGDLGPSLVVRTGTTHAEPHFQEVRVNIAVPDIDGVRIHTQNGDVVARNVQGSIDIVTNDGNVRLMTMRPILGPVSIINNDGDIDYRVRAESTGAIDCEAERGKVSHYTRFGSMVIDRSTDNDTLKATLNGGANPIYLRTSDGNIRVSVVADPANVGAFSRH